MSDLFYAAVSAVYLLFLAAMIVVLLMSWRRGR